MSVVTDARDYVQAHQLERDRRIEAEYRRMRGKGVNDPDLERSRRHANRRRAELNKQAGNKEYRDLIDQSDVASANPNPIHEIDWLAGEWIYHPDEIDSRHDPANSKYVPYQRSELQELRRLAETEHDDNADAAWLALEEKAYELRALLDQIDPFTDHGGDLAGALLAVLSPPSSHGALTRAGMAAAKARGVTLGRPTRLDPTIVPLIHSLPGGTSSIARALNDRCVPSPSGRPWRHSMVAEILRRHPLRLSADLA